MKKYNIPQKSGELPVARPYFTAAANWYISHLKGNRHPLKGAWRKINTLKGMALKIFSGMTRNCGILNRVANGKEPPRKGVYVYTVHYEEGIELKHVAVFRDERHCLFFRAVSRFSFCPAENPTLQL